MRWSVSGLVGGDLLSILAMGPWAHAGVMLRVRSPLGRRAFLLVAARRRRSRRPEIPGRRVVAVQAPPLLVGLHESTFRPPPCGCGST